MTPTWSTACPDWEQRIVAGRSLIPFAPLFPDEAEAALKVFKSLRVVDLPNQPTFGACSDQWVFDFVGAIFGAYDAQNARRLISEFLLLIAKKNSKSTIAAGIMITALIRNWRHTNELTLLAPTMEVANNSYIPASAMVKADPELQMVLRTSDHQRTIKHLTTDAELKVVAADSDTSAGKKSGFILVDELWLFGKKPRSSAMLQEATGGLIARPEGFVIYLTTHSDEPPAGVWKSKLDYFRDVRDGKITDTEKLGVLYEFPEPMIEGEAYLDPDNFYITNPNIGRSVRRGWLETKLKEAVSGGGDDDKQTFLAKHLNVPIGTRLRRDRWAGADAWDSAADPELASLEDLLDRAEVVTAGIDGGGLDDFLGLALIGRERGTQRWMLWTMACCHEKALDRRKDIKTMVQGFAQSGEVLICRSGEEDIFAVANIIEQVWSRGLFPEKNAVGLDPVGVAAIMDELMARELPEDMLVEEVEAPEA